MKLATASLTLLAALPLSARAASPDELRVDITPSELLVDLVDETGDADEAALEELIGADLTLSSPQAKEERFFLARLSPERQAEVIRLLAQDARVEHVEPNFIYRLPEPPLETVAETREPTPTTKGPNDPLWDRQWSLRMIGVEDAWTRTQGKGVVVAVIDTGIAYEDHDGFRRVEDLEGNEFVPGYDFVADDDHPNDDHGHGTHVAGTIAQTTNNKKGVAGIAPAVKLMPLKVLNRNGMGTVADISDAIRFAADEGAKIINMSLGGGPRSAVMESAVAHARRKGLVVVCAAGNGGRGKVEYPAAYPGAFAVSSVGPDKKLAFYSSWGRELAIAAPGGDKQKGGDLGAVLQNTISPDRVGQTDLYLAFQGTSMASPHVAGVAALVASTGMTDPARIEALLKETAEDVGPAGWDDHYGAGIVHADRAVAKAAAATGGLGHFALGLGALLALALRARRFGPGRLLGVGSLLGLLLGGSGLWFLSGLGAPALLSAPLPEWSLFLGTGWHMNPLVASALPVLVLALLTLSFARLRRPLLGLCLGWASYLLFAAIHAPADVALIPGSAGLLDRGWLLLNAGALLLLGWLVARVAARKA